MHHSMTHRNQAISVIALIYPIDQSAYRCRVIARGDWLLEVVSRLCTYDSQRGSRQSDPVNRTTQDTYGRVTGLEQSELDARRAAIDGQDPLVSRCHG
jgi:hypothetical protein